MIDGVGVFEAVRAAITVTQQERAPCQRRSSDLGGQFHHVVEANDRGDFNHDAGGSTDARLVGHGDWLGATGQHQNNGSALGDELQRFERRIQ